MAAGDLYAQIWSRPGSAVFEPVAANIPGQVNGTKRMAGGVGQGDITVPVTWDLLNSVINREPGDPTADVRTLVRIYQEQVSGAALVRDEFFLDNTGDETGEESVRISGAGIGALMADGIVYPWDWDGSAESVSTFPDWIWGGKEIVGPVQTIFKPHIVEEWVAGTGGVISGTLDIGVSQDGSAFEYATVAWNAAASGGAGSVETELEALSYGLDVEVTGFGTEANPWVISILSPPGVYAVADSAAGLVNAAARGRIRQYGQLMPIGWEPSRLDNTSIPHGFLADFRASTGAGSDPPVPAGCSAWIVFDGTEPLTPGVQTVRDVAPGGIYQLNPTMVLRSWGAGALVRVVVRDLDENILFDINGNPAFEEINLVADTDTLISGIEDIIIPEGVTRIVLRIGHIGTGDPPYISVACPSITEGLNPASAGEIVRLLFEDATVDHVADGRVVWEDFANPGTSYLDLTFTDSLDSDGNAWDDLDLKFTAQRGKSYLQLLIDLNHLGYLWNLTPGATPGRWDLNLYNPDWVDTDASLLSTPAINIGSGVTGGPIYRSHLTGNAVTVEGAQMQFGRVESTDSIASVGRREIYQPDRALTTAEMATIRATEEVLSRLLAGLAVSVSVDPVNGPIPFLDYDVDWILNVQIPPALPKSAHRLASITYAIGPDATSYKLSFSSEAFAGPQGVMEGVRRLMLKFEGLDRTPPERADLPPGPDCCPSCMAHATPTIVIISTTGSIVGNFDWVIDNDPDGILRVNTSGNLELVQPGLYTIDFGFRFHVEFTAAGVAPIHFTASVDGNDAPNWEGSYAAVSSGASGAVVNVHGRFYGHAENVNQTIFFGWEVEEAQTYPTANLISKITLPTISPSGATNFKELAVVRHSDGCANERVCA